MTSEQQHPGHGDGHEHGQGYARMDEAAWDERYRSSSALWSGQPNPQLVAEADALDPGAALDVGSGEGADAIWLAERGWRVTAVDLSDVALERAAARALAVGPDVARRIRWQHADVTRWEPPAGAYDLVSAQFMHLPGPERERLQAALAAAVAPRGTLLVVGHDLSDLRTSVPRPAAPDAFFTAGEVAASLDPSRWEVVVSEARERSTLDPDGRPATVRDAVLRARRTA